MVAAPGAMSAAAASGEDADPLADGLSIESALKYYLSRSEVEQVQIQIGLLVLTWVFGVLSFGFAGLLVLARGFTYYLHVQAMADAGEKNAMVEALQQLDGKVGDAAPGAQAAPAPADADDDAPVMLKRNDRKVQRSARPGAQPAPAPADADDDDAPVVLKRNERKVQRSARPVPVQKPAAPKTADLGINFCPCPGGLKITGLKPGTDAADSELQVGDIVTIIGEQFTAGCTPPEVVAALVGPEKSEVEVTAKRTADGKTKRICATIERDAAPRSPEEWIAQWKSGGASVGGPGFLEKLLGPISKAASACMDIATGKKPVGSLLRAVKSAVSLGASTVSGSLSPAAKMAVAEKKRAAARMAAKAAKDESQKKQNALQDEIDAALADGVITEEEQKAIDAKQAMLDEAKRAQEEATNAARQAEADAKATLAKAEAEAQELIKKSQAEAEETLKKAERAAQEQAAAAIDLVNAAEDKAKRKIEEANKLAQQSQAEAEAKKLALKKEIEDAMADGVIDESEQRAIDIKQAALDAAEAAQNEAKAAAAATAAEAATMLAKAEAEAQAMKKKSEEEAEALLKRAQELAKSQAEEAAAAAKMQAEEKAKETIRQAEEEAEKRREELLKQAEAEAKQKIDAATAIAQKAADEEQARKAALQKEIDDAMADGHIDEAEQRAIDAKKAALDEAEKSTQFARQKAADAAAEAKSVRTKAKQEAEKLKKESEEKAAAMLKQAEDEVKKKVAAATKSANEEANKILQESQQKLAAAKAQVEKEMQEIEENKQKAKEEAARLTAQAQEQGKAMMKEVFEMRRKAEEEAKKSEEMAAKVLKDAMADGVIDEEEQKAIDAANAAKKKAAEASAKAAMRAKEVSAKAEKASKDLEEKLEEQQKAVEQIDLKRKQALAQRKNRKEALTAQRSVGKDTSLMDPRVQLTVLSAKHLPSMDLWGKCDGLVEINFDGQKRKTKYIKQNYDPEWNEQFDFVFDRAKFRAKGVGDLMLRVKDWDATAIMSSAPEGGTESQGPDGVASPVRPGTGPRPFRCPPPPGPQQPQAEAEAAASVDVGEAIVSGKEVSDFIKSGEEGKIAEFFDLPVKNNKGEQVKGKDGQLCVISVKMQLAFVGGPQKEQVEEKDAPVDHNQAYYRVPERPRPAATGRPARDASDLYQFMKQEKEREGDGAEGRSNIPALGVKVDVFSDTVTVAAVEANGPCHGLVRQGDSIVKINGVPMLSARQVKQEILFGPPGSNMRLTVFQMPDHGAGVFEECTHILFRTEGPDGRLLIKNRNQMYGMAQSFSPYNSLTQPKSPSSPYSTVRVPQQVSPHTPPRRTGPIAM